MNKSYVDYVIVGGGIFGAYAAKLLAQNSSVVLVEKETALFSRASKKNQTRLHNGCHYLRAPRTASDAQLHHDKFMRDHEFAIMKTSRHYYGIALHDSLTDANGFERFCEWIGIEWIKQENVELLASDRIADVYLVKEFSYDPFLLSQFYIEKLKCLEVDLRLNSEIVTARKSNRFWNLEIRDGDGMISSLETKCVINATYSNINSVSEIFGLPESEIKHEYSEMLLLYVPSLKDTAVTIMDGPFLSVTPYGLTGLHVLSSVIYTHHSSTVNSGERMPCQVLNRICSVDRFSLCQNCRDHPLSRQKLLLNQLKAFIPNIGPIFVHGSLKTIKSTWAIDDYRDERQTSIRKVSSEPDFYNVMSGKVSNIYELKELFDDN